VADELIALAKRRDAWIPEIGIWGPRVYLKDTRKIVDSLDGKLIRIEIN